jgi:hypothetical protein
VRQGEGHGELFGRGRQFEEGVAKPFGLEGMGDGTEKSACEETVWEPGGRQKHLHDEPDYPFVVWKSKVEQSVRFVHC